MRLFLFCLLVQILIGKVTDCDGLDPKSLKCTQDEQDWTQCFEMPSGFLCLMSDEETDLELKFLNSKNQVEVEVNEVKLMVSVGETGYVSIHLKASEKLKIPSSNQIRYGLKNCDSNCDECNVTCQKCSSNYMLYNYQCVEESCLKQISEISEESLVSNVGELIGQDYQLTITFKFPLGNCLIPHVYLTNGLFQEGIKFILPASYRDNELKTQLSQSQYINNCQKIELKDLTIYQCYIGVAVTFQDITQYQMISINKIEIQTTTTQSQSVFVSNDPDYEVGPIEIVSIIKNVVNQGSKIIATQEIADPAYFNYQFNFIEGTAWQGQFGFILDLIRQSYQGNTITYEFNWKDLEFKPNQEFNLEIVSELTKSSKRLLHSDRSQLKVMLLASSKLLINQQTQPQQQTQKSEQFNIQNITFGYWYIIGGSIFLLCVLGVVVIQMFRKPVNMKLE